MLTSRRAFLAGLPAVTAAAAFPTAAAAMEVQSERVERLMMELSDALSGYLNGQFRAIVEPSSAPASNMILQNMRLPTPRSLDARRDQSIGMANIDGQSVVFDHSIAPAVTRVTHEDSGLVAHCSHPEPDTSYVVFDEWGRLGVSGLKQHADYARIAGHPRMGFYADHSSRGREYLRPVLVIGKVLERPPLRA